MPLADELKDEISNLKKDADASKSTPRRRRSKQPDTNEEDVKPDKADARTEDLKELSEKLQNLAEEAGDEIRQHPLAAVLGAFALGLVVGSILRR
jgi:ElaB/YqjD/DUF883 family membrane-anchored ribosome-binding protein